MRWILAGSLRPRRACRQCIALHQRGIVSARVRHGIGEKWGPRKSVNRSSMARGGSPWISSSSPAQSAYLFEWVVDGVAASLQSAILFPPVTSENPESLESVYNIRWSEELLQQDVHSSGHLGHEEVLAQPVQQAVLFPHPLDLLARSEVLRRGSLGSRISPLLVVWSGQHPRRHHERAGRGRSSGKLAFGEHGCCRGGESRRHCRRDSLQLTELQRAGSPGPGRRLGGRRLLT